MLPLEKAKQMPAPVTMPTLMFPQEVTSVPPIGNSRSLSRKRSFRKQETLVLQAGNGNYPRRLIQLHTQRRFGRYRSFVIAVLNKVQHLHRGLDGSLRLVGVEASGAEHLGPSARRRRCVRREVCSRRSSSASGSVGRGYLYTPCARRERRHRTDRRRCCFPRIPFRLPQP